jgi:hypothetical protein
MMEVGDLVEIAYCPFNSPNLFGYQNGEFAIITQLSDASIVTYNSPSAKIWLLRGDYVDVPVIYLRKTGE